MRPHSFSSEFLPKFSPILVNVLVIWIFYWIFTNFGEHFGDLKKLVSFWVTKMSPILMTIIPSDFVFFCHQFWWKFWWFDKIGEFLSDKNITNSGDNNSFRFWVFFVTNFGENFSESLKLSIKKSPKLAKIQGNHQNWWQFCRKSMWAPIWEGGRGVFDLSEISLYGEIDLSLSKW